MKAKYEKMIDAWVKKHYGDLERGVLSDEVKYKVLTKILKKKLKEKKVQVKMLRRLLQGKKEIESWGSDSNPCSGCEHYIPMHPEGLNVIPASCKLGKSMTACCPFYSVKVDEKKAQKEMETCYRCRHSVFKPLTNSMGAATGVLWCEKNKNRCSLLGLICDEFEEKKNE